MNREQAKAFVREIDAVCKKYDVRFALDDDGDVPMVIAGYLSPSEFDILSASGTLDSISTEPEPDDWNTRQVPFTVDKDAS